MADFGRLEGIRDNAWKWKEKSAFSGAGFVHALNHFFRPIGLFFLTKTPLLHNGRPRGGKAARRGNSEADGRTTPDSGCRRFHASLKAGRRLDYR